jgi:prepilin-type N-terminal cleavage/methylation domain-containing protein/prepilin-type processing-associated H-X9-DG protein
MSTHFFCAPDRRGRPSRAAPGFTLIELLVVIGLIAVLASLLLPSLSGSRQQARSVVCLARLKDMGTATVNYASSHFDTLPPMMIDWHPAQLRALERDQGRRCENFPGYGWAELLYADMVPQAPMDDEVHFPAQRNYEDKYGRLFNCPDGEVQVSHSSHYRVYEPGWSREATGVDSCKQFIFTANRFTTPTRISRLEPRLVLIGDAGENSPRGDGRDGVAFVCGRDDTPSCREVESSFIGIEGCVSEEVSVLDSTAYNEANQPRQYGCEPNRFAHRHRGGANYLFGDFHAEHSRTLRQQLGCDWDLNGVHDGYSKLSGCPHPVPTDHGAMP